jgi:ABC-type sulfate transport system permease component
MKTVLMVITAPFAIALAFLWPAFILGTILAILGIVSAGTAMGVLIALLIVSAITWILSKIDESF